MATAYAQGQGVAQDFTAAHKWWSEAAKLGNAEAQTNMGWLHTKGQVVKQDFAEALKWIRTAADQGYAPAQFNLGIMYSRGDGVVADNVEAFKWFTLAARQGEQKAMDARDVLAREMPREQIIEGRLRAAAAVPLRPLFGLENR